VHGSVSHGCDSQAPHIHTSACGDTDKLAQDLMHRWTGSECQQQRPILRAAVPAAAAKAWQLLAGFTPGNRQILTCTTLTSAMHHHCKTHILQTCTRHNALTTALIKGPIRQPGHLWQPQAPANSSSLKTTLPPSSVRHKHLPIQTNPHRVHRCILYRKDCKSCR
jgi:hypothetical protein